jgi:hypothetical protein
LCVSPKLATSGAIKTLMADPEYRESVVSLMKRSMTAELKFVVSAADIDEDIAEIMAFLEICHKSNRAPQYITFQPEGGSMQAVETIAERIYAHPTLAKFVGLRPYTKVRTLPQLHKIGGWQ